MSDSRSDAMKLERDNEALDIVWLLMDTKDSDYARAREECRKKHETDSSWVFSENMKADGMQSMAKVAADSTWVESTLRSTAVLQMFTEDTYKEAYAIVVSPEWVGDPESDGAR